MDKQAYDFLGGEILLVDKPLHWTSFDVVNKLRYALLSRYKIKKIKVGHAGTLDPLATGLLIICSGKATKRIEQFMGLPKSYDGVMRFGATTPSYDLETEIDEEFDIQPSDYEIVKERVGGFIGDIQQMPPLFSAKKVKGKKAYDVARRGGRIELKPADITIYDFEVFNQNWPDVLFKVRCSKGTYIRSLAHDLGRATNLGAHLTELRRTAIGDYSLQDARSLEEWLEIISTAPLVENHAF
ncbi:MAG TPA: tRNA pseudouridine(55) synthase TruB [Flavobacteriales bacterium]|jgi:tRNA pseudouridine55 synthase|nr:tRNA pseudouridine(55) synthase TruB [Flavobacteriales bacterium]